MSVRGGGGAGICWRCQRKGVKVIPTSVKVKSFGGAIASQNRLTRKVRVDLSTFVMQKERTLFKKEQKAGKRETRRENPVLKGENKKTWGGLGLRRLFWGRKT